MPKNEKARNLNETAGFSIAVHLGDRLEDGGSCRIRTYDQLVKSQLLYRLS